MDTYISKHPQAEKWREAAEKANLTTVHDTDDVDFAIWLHMVNDRLVRSLGLGYMDGEDRAWWDSYASGMSPAECAVETFDEWTKGY